MILPLVKKLAPLALTALLLAACNDKAATPPTTTLPDTTTKAITTLSGKVAEYNADYTALVDWTGGEGKVNLTTDGQTVLASAPLNADGTFSFASLPAPADADLRVIADDLKQGVSAECTSTEQISDPNLKSTEASVSVSADKSGGLLLLGADNTQSILVYADRPGNLTGTQTCTEATQTIIDDFDVQLVKGWNYIVSTEPQDMTASTITFSYRSGTPANAKWVFNTSFRPK